MREFVVEATPLKRGGWALEVDGVGVSQARRLEQAAEEMRDAIADVTGLDASQFMIVVKPLLDPSVEESLREVRELQREADQAAAAAAARRREVASSLAASMTVRDVGEIMGVSFQRASQLVKAKGVR